MIQKIGRLRCLLLLLTYCMGALAQAKPLHVLVTGDMHGWLQPSKVDGEIRGGAAEMAAYWKRVEHYSKDDFLILSAGDVATGPAVSTVYKGVPAIEVMNAMGYDASALGNHEIDFGLEQLKAFCTMAQFPFLSANVLPGASGDETLVPEFCVIEKAGLKVGIIGLTTIELQGMSAGGLRLKAYAEAVRAAAPKARARGAQLLLVLAHVPLDELKELAGSVADLGIPLMMGGHSHEMGQAQEGKSGTWVVNSGQWWTAYSRIDLDFDELSGKTTVLSCGQTWLQQKRAEADKGVKAVVQKWQSRLDADPAYTKTLGHLNSPLPRFWPVSNMLCDAWLAMDPESEIVLNNGGAVRQSLEPGPLTRALITSVLPFNDSLYRLKLSGRDLLAYLPKEDLMGLAGIHRKGKSFILDKTGKAIQAGGSYRVLLNNYMYHTSPALKAADPHPVTVFNDWRDPIEQWLLAHPSSPEKPLENSIDMRPRL